MLLILLFLHDYLCFFQIQITAMVERMFFCHNQGLPKCINYALAKACNNLNHCLTSEYDLESGIMDMLQHFLFKFVLNHVKGYQDDDTPVKDISWEA
jgi:hypothetical protein